MKQMFCRTTAILLVAATLAMFAVGCEDKENEGTLFSPAASAVKKDNMEESTTDSDPQESTTEPDTQESTTEPNTREATMEPVTAETFEEPSSTEIYVEQAAPYEVGELSVELLTSHWLMKSVQSSYVFRFLPMAPSRAIMTALHLALIV